MNVGKILVEYLDTNGFDGLCNVDGECGCAVNDFSYNTPPCSNETSGICGCQPAYEFKCWCCKRKNECEVYDPDYTSYFSYKRDYCDAEYY